MRVKDTNITSTLQRYRCVLHHGKDEAEPRAIDMKLLQDKAKQTGAFHSHSFTSLAINQCVDRLTPGVFSEIVNTCFPSSKALFRLPA